MTNQQNSRQPLPPVPTPEQISLALSKAKEKLNTDKNGK